MICRANLTTLVTPRSFAKHQPTTITYHLSVADSHIIRRQTREYIPTNGPITLPQVDIHHLPLDSNSPLKILIFIPTYSSEKYIGKRIEEVLKQTASFPPNWTFELLVVVNGSKQQSLWQTLLELKSQTFGPKLAIAFIAKEENPGMLQAKITPLNVALEYAKERGFEAFCSIDDDVVLSENNLTHCLRALQAQTLTRQTPVITGAQLRSPDPKTTWDHIFARQPKATWMVRGGNLCGWTEALPYIPADAFSEDLLLNLLYQPNTHVIQEAGDFVEARFASTFGKYLTQDIRFKWCDALAVSYLPQSRIRSFWNLVKDNARRIIPKGTPDLKTALCQALIRSINLYTLMHVRISILLRNIFNLPKKTVDWVGTVDATTKNIDSPKV